MVGTIERQLRRLSTRVAVPMTIVMIGANLADPTHRATGYGGVLPLPAPAPTVKVDPLLPQKQREHRAPRGRVLYAPGHEPKAAAPTPAPGATANAKPTCPDQRLSQRGHPAASPET